MSKRIINNANEKISNVRSEYNKVSEQVRSQKQEIDNNSELTSNAKRKRKEQLERDKNKQYKQMNKQIGSIVSDTMNSLSKRLYEGENSNPIQFDTRVNELSNKKSGELISLLEQNPGDETRRAILKASTLNHDSPRFKVLEKAAQLDDSVKKKVEPYISWQEQYGVREPSEQKNARKLFGSAAV